MSIKLNIKYIFEVSACFLMERFQGRFSQLLLQLAATEADLYLEERPGGT